MGDSLKTFVKDFQDRFVDVMYYIGNIYEISVCVLFVAHFCRRKPSSISGAFFYILFIGYVLDVVYELGFTCQRYLTKDFNPDNAVDILFFRYFESLVQWYFLLFIGPATVLLALNRLTSIFFITEHKEIWSKWFPIILGLLLLYPFIVAGYTFENITCRLDVYSPPCVDFNKRDFLTASISNVICAFASLLIGIVSAIMYRIKLSNNKQTQTKNLKIEHKLLIQSILSNSMFGFYALLSILDPYFYELEVNPDYFVLDRIYRFITDAAYISYHYGSIVLLFIFSVGVRSEFCKFYHIEWIFQRKSKVFVITSSQQHSNSKP